VQRQIEESRILKARYNKRYREITLDGRSPSYLKSENSEETNIEDKMRVLIKLRCDNMEE